MATGAGLSAEAMARLVEFAGPEAAAAANARAAVVPSRSPGESIEERCFGAALICLDGHFSQSPPVGPLTMARVNSIIARTLEKTHTQRTAREAISRNVEIWLWLTRNFTAAIPSLTARSVGPLSSLNDPEKGVTPQESTALIVLHHASIKEDLGILIKLMHIARNLLVSADPVVPQDICAAVNFDQMVYQTIVLCTNVTSKGYDGEILDDSQRIKLSDVTELYKKLLVTSLQQAHNWTAKHDRNKMSFWLDVLFEEEESAYRNEDGLYDGDGTGFRSEVAKRQVQNWLQRNSRMCDTARQLLRDYVRDKSDKPPGTLSTVKPLAWNWLQDPRESAADADGNNDQDTHNHNHGNGGDDNDGTDQVSPVWKPDEQDKVEQDRAYGRVSREIDSWWLRARDPNYEDWAVAMPSVEFAKARTDHCKDNLVHRYAYVAQETLPPAPDHVDAVVSEQEEQERCRCPERSEGLAGEHAEHGADHGESEPENYEDSHHHHHHHHHHHDNHQQYQHHRHHHNEPNQEHHDHEPGHGPDRDDGHIHPHEGAYRPNEYIDDMVDEEEADDVSYSEAPLTGLLTEVPNVLDPKQIEALHMIIKSCILDSAGSGLTRVGENLQKSRCRMFLALDCGRSLLRELLVFLAVWDQEGNSLLFQVTAQIVEAIHHSALIPYAWSAMRMTKDIISPAQTVLLRLVAHMFSARARHGPATTAAGMAPHDVKDSARDMKLLHYFFGFFRGRIVPECAALINLQAQVRRSGRDPDDFPVDNWDMERAKDGLGQFLDLLIVAAEAFDMRAQLIDWEAIYEFVTILAGLEAAVEKKPLAEVASAATTKAKAGKGRAKRWSSEEGPARPEAVERPYSAESPTSDDSPVRSSSMSPPRRPISDPAWKFPWAGIKCQIVTLIATMLQPPPGLSSPGNAQVQRQMVKFNGIAPLLNCCVYDEHNRFAKERVTVCLKWLLDRCESAKHFFRELESIHPRPYLGDGRSRGDAGVSAVRVDGIEGEVKIRMQQQHQSGRKGESSNGGGRSRGKRVADADADADADLLDRGASMGLDEAGACSGGGNTMEDEFMP